MFALLVWHDDREAGTLKGPYKTLEAAARAADRALIERVNCAPWRRAEVLPLGERVVTLEGES